MNWENHDWPEPYCPLPLPQPRVRPSSSSRPLRPVFVLCLLFPLLLPLPSPPTSPPPSPLSSYLSSSLLLLLLPLSFYNVSQCDLLTWESVAKLEMPLERLLNELRVSWFAVRTVRGWMTIMLRCTKLFWRSVIIVIVLSPPSGSGAVSLWYPRLSLRRKDEGIPWEILWPSPYAPSLNCVPVMSFCAPRVFVCLFADWRLLTFR